MTRPTRNADADRDSARRGLAWLTVSQEPDGEFPSIVAGRRDLRGPRAPDTNFFTTPQVLWSLSFVRGRSASNSRHRAAEFIRSGQREGCWRFFTDKVRRRIDPDVDATACAVAALKRQGGFDAASAREAMLRAMTPDGRFWTWIRRDGPNDVDSVANANVLWALGDDVSAKAAAQWVSALIIDGKEDGTFPYYESPMALYHAASRALWCGATALEPARESMIRAVLRRQGGRGGFGAACETAFACCTLINLGLTRTVEVAKARSWLRAAQRQDGAWPECAVWNGPEWPEPRSLWWGSHAWTTALAIEALSR